MHAKARWIILLATAALSLGAPTAQAKAAPQTASVSAPDAASSGRLMRPMNGWENYYHNYFENVGTCNNRGRQIADPNSYAYIPGFIDWYCYRVSGEVNWSMDIYRD